MEQKRTGLSYILAGGILNVCRQGIMFIPVILLLPTILGLTGIIYSQAVADLFTTIVTIIFAISIHKKLRHVENSVSRSASPVIK